jgi:hypothetical protein
MSWLFDQSGAVDWRWIITALVAAYAALVATYREFAARRERAIDVRIQFFTSMVVLLGDQMTPHVQVRIENHGRPEVTFDSNCASLEWRGGTTRLLLWDCIRSVQQWPHRLSGGSSFYVMAPTAPLRELLRTHDVYQNADLRAVVSDAIGRQSFSNWVTLPAAD